MEWVFIGLMFGGVLTGYPVSDHNKTPSSITLYVSDEGKCKRIGDRFVALSVNDGLKAKYECVFVGK